MANKKQLSFSGGEITPALYARVDQTKYQTGLKTCENFMVMRHGGTANRPGTGFISEVCDSTGAVRLIPFVFNSTQTYVLEFGYDNYRGTPAGYMRVHQAGALLTEAAKTITGATQADPCVITTSAAHGYSNDDEVFHNSVEGMTELNNRNFKIANVTATTYELKTMDGTDLDATGYTAYVSGGAAEKVYEIVSPYALADLAALQYVQSADVITLTHPSYAPRELTRSGHTSWAFAAITFGASISPPAGLASDASGSVYYYKVTSVDIETGEESLPNSAVGSSTQTSNLSWTQVATAGYYNVYKLLNGEYGWIGVAGAIASPTFKCNSYDADLANTPPVDRQPFSGADDYPSTCTLYQQRMIYANTNNNTEGTWASKTALRKNFMVSNPIQDDDAVTFTMVGRQVNSIEYLLDIGKLLAFTTSGEWVIDGDAAGILTPSGINPRLHTANGSGTLPPIVVDGTALYIQARGSLVRDIGYDFESDGYKGNELSIFSAHMFDDYTLVDWTYQQIPHSIVWAARSDGTLLGMTYVRQHEVNGWHRHVFSNGSVENVCVVPEGTEDVLYMVINRTIEDRTVRYVEYMKTRKISDVRDMVFLDSSLTYDGRNTTAIYMALYSFTGWLYTDDLYLTSDQDYFSSDDVGSAIWLNSGTETLRCEIISYSSATAVYVRAHKTVPEEFRSVVDVIMYPITDWEHAVLSVQGLWHLEGEDVNVLVDGYVSSTKTVSNGTITFDDPHVVIHAGIQIIADLETLDIERAEGQSLVNKKKHVNGLSVYVENSSGFWAGPDADNLVETKVRSDEGYDEPVDLQTGTIDVGLQGDWSKTGSVLIRQTAPLPLEVLAVVPSGYLAK